MSALGDARAILERTPRALDALLRGLPDAWGRTTPGPGVWSPYDIVGHLNHGERTDWIPRARVILEHGETKAFEPFDRESMFDASAGRTLDELLDDFAALRARSLAELDALGITDLDARGLHPDLGPVTIGELIATWATHDLAHVAQIGEVMAKRNRIATGPWRAYLPVLDRPDLEGD